MRFKGEQEAFDDFAIARRRLTNSVLAAVERDDLKRQKLLSEAVEGAFSNLKKSEALEPEDTLDQLRQLTDGALRELR